MEKQPLENIRLPWLAKATPHEEGGQRFLYLEASNEDKDRDGEVVLQKALAESANYYLRHGNVDLCHYTLIGLKHNIPNHLAYEVGKPVDVRFDTDRTFVKAELYQGESPMAQNANLVWDSLTKQNPPSRWYPSVGGKVLAKSAQIDHDTHDRFEVIEKVLWNNIALDRQPINSTVPEASNTPIGLFAKSLNAYVVKALEAGGSTDVATLTGGGALGVQSLDTNPVSYYDRRDKIASLLLGGTLNPDNIRQAAIDLFGLSAAEATDFTNHFLTDIAHRRRYV
jgi:hypothetical protein